MQGCGVLSLTFLLVVKRRKTLLAISTNTSVSLLVVPINEMKIILVP